MELKKSPAAGQVKIKITEGRYYKNKDKIAGYDEIKCQFNPKDYTIQRSVQWTAAKTASKNSKSMSFASGAPTSVQLELFFDTYEEEAGSDAQDVRKSTEKLWDLIKVDPEIKDKKSKTGRPPKVLFQWGKGHIFETVVQSVSEKFTMFTKEGVPVRSTVQLGLLSYTDLLDLDGTNPTSGGDGGERIWTVQQGETLGLIAHRALGDSKAWRSIAAMNRLEDVRNLKAGTVLVIPNA